MAERSFPAFAKAYLGDIRFWLLLYFLIHLLTIRQPPIEPSHSWRQCLTHMMARNFFQESTPVQYPRVDIAGEKEGYVASEFPLFPYLISLSFKLFGFSHWYGRLINLMVSFIGIWFFYQAVKLYSSNEKLAFWSAFFLLNSIWFSFSRKIMPDTFSVSLCLIAGYYALLFLKSKQAFPLITFVLLATLGVLCKMPAALVLVPVSLLVFDKNIAFNTRVLFLLSGFMALIFPLIWYQHWVPHLVSTYRFEQYFPKSLPEGLSEVLQNWSGLIEKIVYNSFFSFTSFLLAVFGVYLIFKAKNQKIIVMVFLVGLIFSFYIIKTGAVFPTHSYYIVPFVPLMALAAGYGFSNLKFQQRYLFFISLMAVSESTLTQMNDFFIRPNRQYLLSLETQCDSFSNRNNRIVCNGTPNPQLMYFLNRRGWTVTNEELLTSGFSDSLIRMNAYQLILDRHIEGTDVLVDRCRKKHPVIYSSEDLVAFDLKK